jgi:diacylglycerol kinase family enzyme
MPAGKDRLRGVRGTRVAHTRAAFESTHTAVSALPENVAGLLRGPVPVFVNARAGRGAAAIEREIAEALEHAGVPARVLRFDPEDLVAGVREAVRAHEPIIGVAGGDGTLSTAVAAVMGSDTALAVFPVGTLNHFARRLGIDSIETAAKLIAQGCIAELPVGSVNGRIFINNASCGFYPHIVRTREVLRPVLTKWPAAAVSALFVLLRLPMMEIEMDFRGYRIRRRTSAVWVGIGHGSFRLPRDAETADEDANSLEVIVPKHGGRFSVFALAASVLMRLARREPITSDPRIDVLHTRSFAIDARRPVDLARDGEVTRLDPPVAFKIHDRALRVVCPELG